MSKYAVTIDGRSYELEFDLPLQRGREFQVTVDGEAVRVRIPLTGEIDWVIVDDRPYEVYVDGGAHLLQSRNSLHVIDVRDRDTATRALSADGRIKAPIPGMIARVLVEPGQTVEIGQPLIILEAMKMENEIRAPRDGIIAAVHVNEGRIVPRGELLAEVT